VPLAIDVYQNGEKKRYKVWLENKVDTFAFPAALKPDLINVDGDKILLCQKTDQKTIDNYTFQYKNAGLYVDRREAVDYAAREQGKDPKAVDLLKTALKDQYHGLRLYALQKLNTDNDSALKTFETLIVDMSKNDPNSLVRAAAIEALGRSENETFKPIFLKSINDSSYSIAGKALIALSALDSIEAIKQAGILEAQKVKGDLDAAITDILFKYSDEKDFETLAARFDNLPFGNDKFRVLQPFSDFLKRVNNTANFKKGIDMIVSFRDTIPVQYRGQIAPYLNGMILNGIAQSKVKSGLTEHADYIKSKIPSKPNNPVVSNIDRDNLKKFTGEYDMEGTTVKIVLKDNNTLNMILPDQPDMELTALTKTKFEVKFMEGFTIEFVVGDKEAVTEFIFNTPDGTVNASKKN
jgi:aminopeptidase N